MGTVVVGVLVFGSAGLILWHMWRRHKQGGGCAGCGGPLCGWSGGCSVAPKKKAKKKKNSQNILFL